MLRQDAVRPTQLARSLTAAVLAALLAGSPVFAQDPGQSPPPSEQQPHPELPTPQSPEQNRPGQDPHAPTQNPQPAYGSGPVNPPIPVSLGVSKYSYRHAPRPFPNLFKPYRPISIPEFGLTNSPRVDQLIHDGKLEITLQDAVELALENSMDIAVARYNPWFGDTDILAAEGGGLPQGVSGAEIRFSNANVPFLNFDPILTSSVGYDDRSTPINNPFISGTGTGTTASGLISHTAQYNNQYTQGFATGTTVTAIWDNARSSSTSAANFFNPTVQSSLTIQFQQQLLNGFGLSVNRRNILIAKNNRRLADYAFEQQAITTVTNTITAYWELVYARENVKVEEQAVTVSNKLYGDNRKQLEIGTMAPLDVTRAESELASDRQNLIIAQTVKLQDEQILKNAISRDPLSTSLINVEIVPLDHPNPPEAVESGSFEDAIKEAFAKRPDLLEQEINVKNAAIDARATRQALLPTATLQAQYLSSGLAGNSPIVTGSTTKAGTVPLVGANGQPISVLDMNGVPVEIFNPVTSPVTDGVNHGGLGNAQSQIFHNQFPDYFVGVNIQIPIRNRQAQATNQRAVLNQRQIEAQMQQLRNAALLDVRNTYIALTQGRAQVQAASKARELQQQTFDAEQKKYQLGASTVYNVILTQRDLITAQGAELRALANLVEDKANFERAVGRTLEVNRVTIADAKHGQVERDTLIPGTLNGQVVGTEKIFANEGQR
jgi:outer membrane protein